MKENNQEAVALLQFEINEELLVNNETYFIGEHPNAPGIPYGQEGRQAVVYNIYFEDDNGIVHKNALKAFKPRYKAPYLVYLATRLERYSSLPGLSVCQRSVITPQKNTSLLRQYPDLTYSVLMDWIEGPTWMEIMLEKKNLSPEQSLLFAKGLVDILCEMEQNGIAHCDLSGPNILLPGILDPQTENQIELVDVEQMFGGDLARPPVLTSGSPGYAHLATFDGVWQPEADRFAGAVLIAEMLGCCDSHVRKSSWGESYFDPNEMQTDCSRYNLLKKSLTKNWGSTIVEMLEKAWYSSTLSECPTFGEWLIALPDRADSPVNNEQDVPEQIDNQIVTLSSTPETTPDNFNEQDEQRNDFIIQILINLGRRFESQNNYLAAVEVYSEALTYADNESAKYNNLGKLAVQAQAKLTGETTVLHSSVGAAKLTSMEDPDSTSSVDTIRLNAEEGTINFDSEDDSENEPLEKYRWVQIDPDEDLAAGTTPDYAVRVLFGILFAILLFLFIHFLG